MIFPYLTKDTHKKQKKKKKNATGQPTRHSPRSWRTSRRPRRLRLDLSKLARVQALRLPIAHLCNLERPSQLRPLSQPAIGDVLGLILRIYFMCFSYGGASQLCHYIDTPPSWVLGWSLFCGGPAHQIAWVRKNSAGVDQKTGAIYISVAPKNRFLMAEKSRVNLLTFPVGIESNE